MLSVRLFGPMQIRAADGRDLTPSTQKARAIIAMILVADGAVRSRNWLIDHLWSTKPRELALASLRQSLKEIRKCLGPWAAEVLKIDNFVVAIDSSKIIIEDSDRDIASHNDFLEGIDIGDPEFEDWLTLERSRLGGFAQAKPRHAEESREAPAQPAKFGLRIDPPIVSGLDPEEDELAANLLDEIVVSLVEEGFHDLHDRRKRTAIPLSSGGWRYPLCLRCSVSRIADRARIVLALVDLAEEQTIWIRRFDTHVFAIRSGREPEIAAGLAQCVDRIWQEKEAAARRFRFGEDGADVMRAAIQDIFELSATDLARAEHDLRRLITTRHGALASAWLAFLLTFRVGQRFVQHDGTLHDQARELIARAMEREPGNAVVLALAGHVHSFLFGNYVSAVDLFERAVRINPNRALVWDLYSVLHAYIGRPKEGLQCALFGRHLGAHSIHRYYFDTSCLITASMLGDHRRAIDYGEAVLEERPAFNSVLRFLTASYAHSGDVANADKARQLLLGIEPSFSIETLREARYPGLDTTSGKYFIQGLKKAGIREVAT